MSKIKLLTITWSHENNFEIENTSLYKSFKKFNPHIEIIHHHFNRGHYYNLEREYGNKFHSESEYLLYKITLLHEKIKDINSEYIIFSDANDVTCLKPVDFLIDVFDLESYVIFGHEKNIWPTIASKSSWPNYKDYSEYNILNKFYLNSGMILGKKELFISMLENIINNVFSTGIQTFNNDQGVYTYYYNMELEPKIKLDYSNIFAVNTFNRTHDEYYLNKDNKIVSNYNGVVPCFVHDNGWNHGSPKYQNYFELYKLYL